LSPITAGSRARKVKPWRPTGSSWKRNRENVRGKGEKRNVADRGHFTEQVGPGPEPEIPAEAVVAFMSWEDWAREVQLRPIAAERVVYHGTYAYAGTLDLYAVVRGKLTVLDYKTGKAIYPESFLQNIAYRAAAAACGMPSDQGLIVRLPKTLEDPAFETMIVPESVTLETFLATKKVWEFKRAMDGKAIA
jgi:hypothetical protein